MLQSVFGAISSDLAIDLGTSTTRVSTPERGIICCQPSVVAVQELADGRRQVVAVGDEALVMDERVPPDIRIVRPIADGVIADFEVAEALLKHLMVQVQGRRLWVGPRMAVCVPSGITDLERRALREAAEGSGARSVVLIEEPLAAAVGMELPTDQARGHLIVDVGAGSTQIAVISLGGVVHARTLKVGGLAMDQAIIQRLRETHGLIVGPRSAEALKRQHASAVLQRDLDVSVAVRGKDAEQVFPREVELPAAELSAALQGPVDLICEAVMAVLDKTPPDLASDIADSGVLLVGGAAQLRNLDRAISDATALPVIVPPEPQTIAVQGACTSLRDAWTLEAVAS